MSRSKFVALNALGLLAQPALAQEGARVLAPGRPVINPNILRVPARVPFAVPTVTIVDPGYAVDEDGGGRTVSIGACVAAQGNTEVPITAMRYALATPGQPRTGEMGPYFAPPKKPITMFNGGTTVQANPPGTCRRAKFAINACDVTPGDYDLSITADLPDGRTLTAKGKTTVPGYLTTVSVLSAGGFTVATPGNVAGKADGSCGLRPRHVRLFADNGAQAVVTPVDPAGNWTAPFVFARPGGDTLHAGVEPEAKLDSSFAARPVTVGKTPVAVTLSEVPTALKIGTPTTATAQVRHRDTKALLAGFPVTMALGDTKACSAVTGADGSARCTLIMPTDVGQVNHSVPVVVSSAAADSVEKSGTVQALALDAQGLVSQHIGANLLEPMLASQAPYGVLLDNYNPKWSGTGAHLTNASRSYPTSDPSKSVAFDIPTFHVSEDIVFYVNNVLIRMKPFTTKAPARLSTELFITAGPEARGPSIKGFCFDSFCYLPLGYDDVIPDITSISMPIGTMALNFAVVDGKVRASLAQADVTLSFNCGGVSSFACGSLRSYVNDQIRAQLKGSALLKPLLARVGDSMTAGLQPWLAQWHIKTLTGIAFDDEGGMTVTGTPLTS